MYLVCFRIISVSLNASHSLNYVLLGNIGLTKDRGYDLRFSTLFHLRTSITSDEFWATFSLFRFCFIKILSVPNSFAACLSVCVTDCVVLVISDFDFNLGRRTWYKSSNCTCFAEAIFDLESQVFSLFKMVHDFVQNVINVISAINYGHQNSFSVDTRVNSQ